MKSSKGLLTKGAVRFLAGAAGAAYAIFLLAKIPASVANPWPDDLSVAGTVWKGDVELAGGNRGHWAIDPARSIATASIAADLTVSGPGTELSGRVAVGPHRVTLTRVKGTVSPLLAQSYFPDLPRCEGEIRMDAGQISWNGKSFKGAAHLRTTPMSCAKGIERVPALTADLITFDGDLSATILKAENPAEALARVELASNGRLQAELLPAAAPYLSGVTVPAAGVPLFKIESGISLP